MGCRVSIDLCINCLLSRLLGHPTAMIALVVYLDVIGGSGKYERERIQDYPVVGILEVKYLPDPQTCPTLPPNNSSLGE